MHTGQHLRREEDCLSDALLVIGQMSRENTWDYVRVEASLGSDFVIRGDNMKPIDSHQTLLSLS